jgi:hypothetical protein
VTLSVTVTNGVKKILLAPLVIVIGDVGNVCFQPPKGIFRNNYPLSAIKPICCISCLIRMRPQADLPHFMPDSDAPSSLIRCISCLKGIIFIAVG